MSVICHNFVQNAWKKDLCSNCFKSVGDHEGEEVGNGNSPSSLPNGSSRQVSHSTNVYSSNSNGTTPHTTWKSLISERNQKNSQPFKLENGFQGRLLTINKASHPGEKKVAGEVNIQQNGYVETTNRTTFAQSKTVNTSASNGFYSHNGEPQSGIQKDVNDKIKFNGVKSMLNEIESKNGKPNNTVNKKNGIEQSSRTGISDQKNNSQKLIKSDTEERSPSPPQSILKKTVSTPKTNSSQPRRGSNVGFKDEEPLVIGYGGRDFTPEELAWDMNCSDGENEPGSDSLDETEDDKAFSKMTKQNTEFNSDNSNLLIQQKQNVSGEYNKSKSAYEERVNTSNEKENSKTSVSKNQQSESNSKEENESYRTNAVQSNLDRNNSIEKENPQSKEHKGQINKSNEENGPMKVEVKNCETRNEKSDRMKDKDFMNAPINNEKRDQAVTAGEIVVVEGAKKASVSSEDKNNSELGNETTPPPPSPVVGTKNAEGESGSETSDHSEMFSDGNEISKENGETEVEENGEWQENEVAGQILQAINTSLTNRHKMNNETNVENGKFTESEKDLDNDGKEPIDLKQTSSESVTVSVCDKSVEKSECESQQVSESVLNVEPRPSFLHGRVSNCKAIYGPASDLFVSRSNSSSSSSSDECNRNEMPHSITVTVNGQNARKPVVRSASAEILNVAVHPKPTLTDYETDSSISSKYKPRIPAKPSKRPTCSQSVQIDSGHYAKPTSDVKSFKSDRRKSESNISQNGAYYAVTDTSDVGGPKSISLVDHYAESNIYHEVILDTEESKLQDIDENDKQLPKRESKLAALAMELEQVRHSGNNTKRQAPAPPKIPDPPLEDPPNSSGRISPPDSDSPNGFSSFRGEAMAFSSSSSTASTSSQDTETGYASWNLNGDLEEKRKHSKSKSSFLLAQYSKCKMLAMGYADDSAKSRKKFSIKKLLKIRKDSTENNSAFDSNYPNPKAWKYSDHFERPRARLEIIHPMDLENKSVTVNPGFDSLHSGSLSSFTASADDLSLRNSMSSDYGSFYSDTVSPFQDMKTESNYECIPNSRLLDSEEQEESDEKIATCNSNSPTPSRSSNASQASTLTSESSKNGSAASIRPPKPPPPPRAHSLLPRNKPQNADGTFKFPVEKINSINEDESMAPSKPQAPKRQGKSTAPRPDCGIYDNTSSVPISSEKPQSSADNIPSEDSEEIEESEKIVLDIKSDFSQNSQKDNLEPSVECSSPVIEETLSETQVNILSVKADTQKINVTVKNTLPDTEKNLKTAITRNKHPPVTKAPSRPPPIYMKPQLTIVAKKPNPWKTLEDSYLVLTTSNRELLVKLVNQAAKKRKVSTVKLQKIDFKWTDFEIDLEQPSSIFAFGEKIAYHATMPQYPEYLITLVVTVQQAHNRLSESNELKYPVFGQFVDSIPHELLDSSGDGELESMQATILVLDRSNITTIECFTESLPSCLTDEYEKELSFIILQLIHSLKSLQAQGIESIDSSFHNLILAKTKMDKYNTLIFLSDNCYDENDYMSESCRISLCQYALILLFQLLGIQSVEEFDPLSETKFSSEVARKTFEIAIELLSEEKAVSLSQTKTLMECFLWELIRVREILEESDDADSVLQRWMDVKRSNFIKNVINDETLCDINVQSEYYSQFLIRTSIRNVKDILSYF